MKIVYVGIFLIVLCIVGFIVTYTPLMIVVNDNPIPTPIEEITSIDYRNTTYTINGTPVTLVDGISEMFTTDDSAAKTITAFYDFELLHDLNGDGSDDVAFILTQTTGGSGTFYYVVSALQTENGWKGGDALFLGDRIEPLNVYAGPGKSIVVNYNDRQRSENFVVLPTITNSIRLMLDENTMQFGEVVQDFEGEADPTRMSLTMKTWVWNTDPKFSITFTDAGTFSATTDCNNMSGSYNVEMGSLSFDEVASTLMYCEGSRESEFGKILASTQSYRFTTKGELVLDIRTREEFFR